MAHEYYRMARRSRRVYRRPVRRTLNSVEVAATAGGAAAAILAQILYAFITGGTPL